MDRLEIMMTAQRDLQARVMGYRFADMTLDQRISYIKEMVLALSNELQSEVLGEVSWKSWASSRFINVKEYKGELVDAFHFLLNLMLVVDMTPDELYALYLQKRDLNVLRQLEGYDGLSSKCPGCGRAQDDVAVACYEGDPEAPAPNNLPWCDRLKVRVDRGHTVSGARHSTSD